MHKTSIHDPHKEIKPEHLRIEGKIHAWKSNENSPKKTRKSIVATMKASIHSEVRFCIEWWRKSKPME
jgi:hypothetical protein